MFPSVLDIVVLVKDLPVFVVTLQPSCPGAKTKSVGTLCCARQQPRVTTSHYQSLAFPGLYIWRAPDCQLVPLLSPGVLQDKNETENFSGPVAGNL